MVTATCFHLRTNKGNNQHENKSFTSLYTTYEPGVGCYISMKMYTLIAILAKVPLLTLSYSISLLDMTFLFFSPFSFSPCVMHLASFRGTSINWRAKQAALLIQLNACNQMVLYWCVERPDHLLGPAGEDAKEEKRDKTYSCMLHLAKC